MKDHSKSTIFHFCMIQRAKKEVFDQFLEFGLLGWLDIPYCDSIICFPTFSNVTIHLFISFGWLFALQFFYDDLARNNSISKIENLSHFQEVSFLVSLFYFLVFAHPEPPDPLSINQRRVKNWRRIINYQLITLSLASPTSPPFSCLVWFYLYLINLDPLDPLSL